MWKLFELATVDVSWTEVLIEVRTLQWKIGGNITDKRLSCEIPVILFIVNLLTILLAGMLLEDKQQVKFGVVMTVIYMTFLVCI